MCDWHIFCQYWCQLGSKISSNHADYTYINALALIAFMSLLLIADNSPPVVSITSDDSPYSTRNPSFTFESSEESTFLCAIDSTRFYQPCGRGLRSQFTASNVLDGQHAFFVQGTDLSGNIGNHERYIFTVGKYLSKQVTQSIFP